MSKRRRPQPRPRPAQPTPQRAGLTQTPAFRDPPAATKPPPGSDAPINAGHVQALIGLVATGGLDPYLSVLEAAIQERHSHLLHTESHRAKARIDIGDRVRINHTIRPLYLHGATGTVVDWAGQRFIVQLDHPTGRFTTGEVRCPPLGLDPLPT